jgi:hypothetical protein
MQKVRQKLLTIWLAVAAAIFCSGCPALMIPGLAYSGYKYEHDKNQPAIAPSTSTPSAKATTAKSNKATTAQRQKIPDSEIE